MGQRLSTSGLVGVVTVVGLGLAVGYLQLIRDTSAMGELAELPVPDLRNALPVLAEQVRDAYEGAKAESDAVAEYCLVLHAYEQLTAAETCYRRLQQLAAGDFRWAYLLAVVQQSLGKPEEAAVSYGQTIKLESWFFPATLELAELLLELGETERAGTLYRELIDRHVDAAAVQSAVGRWYMSLNHVDRAIELLEQAVETEPHFAEAHYALAVAYRVNGNVQEARKHMATHERYRGVRPVADPLMAQVMRRDRSVRRRLEYAGELVASGRYWEAISEYEGILKIDPRNALAHANLITTHANLGSIERAEAHYRSALEVRPDWAQAHYLFGRAKLEAGSPDDAIGPLNEAVLQDPFDGNAHLLLGSAFERVGRLGEAAASYREAIQISPGNRAARLQLGALLWTRGETEQTEYHFQRVVEIEDDRTAQFYSIIGQFYLAQGQLYRAVDHFRAGEQSARAQGADDIAEQLKRQRVRALINIDR